MPVERPASSRNSSRRPALCAADVTRDLPPVGGGTLARLLTPPARPVIAPQTANLTMVIASRPATDIPVQAGITMARYTISHSRTPLDCRSTCQPGDGDRSVVESGDVSGASGHATAPFRDTS